MMSRLGGNRKIYIIWSYTFCMKSLTKIRSVGGSLIVTIPSEIVKKEKLTNNEFVEIEIRRKSKNFFGLLPDLSEFSEKDRTRDRD